jgi:hypothetical protein
MPLLNFFSLLPVVMIVACSILLDYALSHEKTASRCHCQLYMWMAVSLSWTPENSSILDPETDNSVAQNNVEILFYAWAHMTLFLNVLSIVTECTPLFFSWNTSQEILPPTRTPHSVQVVRLLSVSSLSSMLYSACEVCGFDRGKWPQSAISSLKLFLATFLVLRLACWRFKRQDILEECSESPTMHTTALAEEEIERRPNRFCGHMSFSSSTRVGTNQSFSLETGNVDENHWYLWNRRQTLQWLSQQLMENEHTLRTVVPLSSSISMDQIKEEHDMLLSKFSFHLISGDILEELADASKLMLLQIPFGPAYRLSKCIGRLINRFPNPEALRSSRDTYSSDIHITESSLLLHDQVYNSSHFADTMDLASALSPQKRQVMAALDATNATETLPSKVIDRLGNVTIEKFGLGLPKVHPDNGRIPESSTGHDQMQQVCQRTLSEQLTNDLSSSSSYAAATNIPPRFLDRMPSHIKEIATRRPELVKVLLVQKQKEMRHLFSQKGRKKTSDSIQSQRSQTGHRYPKDLSSKPRAEEADTVDAEVDSDDDETTSLIQHDVIYDDQVRYRSIDKTNGLG